MATPALPNTLPDGQELEKIIERARKGDETTLPVLRQLFKDPRAVDRLGGDLARQAEYSLIRAAAGKDAALREALERKLELLRADLAGPAPTPLERLLVERVAACWLQLHYAETLIAQQAQNFSLVQAEHYDRMRDSAHKRYLSAIKALALVRKLAVPVLQVNIARKQVNVAGGLPNTARPLTRGRAPTSEAKGEVDGPSPGSRESAGMVAPRLHPARRVNPRPHSRRHRLPLAGPRPGPTRQAQGGAPGRAGAPAPPAGAPALRPLAARLPRVPGEGRRADGRRPAHLALWPLAPLPVGELAAAGAPQLPALRQPPLLVPQPAKCRLRRLRDANATPLTCAAGWRRESSFSTETGQIGPRNQPGRGGNQPFVDFSAQEAPSSQSAQGHGRQEVGPASTLADMAQLLTI
jgi:hypothetical protein